MMGDVVQAELRSWLEAMRLALGAESASVWIRQTGRPVLSLAVRIGRGEAEVEEELPLDGHALGWVVSEGLALRASREDVFLDSEPVGWVVAAPLAPPREERLGCVVVEFAEEPSGEATQALELAAVLAGRLIAEAESARRARRALERYIALNAAIHDLDRKLDLRELALAVCRRARQVSGARGAAIASWDHRSRTGGIVATHGDVPGGLSSARLQGESSFFGLALTNSSVLPRDDLSAGARYPLYVDGIQSRAGSAIIVPLVMDDEPIGGIAVEYERRRQFEEADLERLKTLALFVAPAFRNALSFGEVKAQSMTDALTGLPNRRATERALASTIAIADRTGNRFSVAIADVDHFKKINDSHGHEAGDEVLQTVARTLKGELRPGDHAGRWGGEEFLLVLPNTSPDDAAHVMERVRSKVEALDVVWQGRTLRVTLSAGVSSYPGAAVSPAAVVASADGALYEAKREGRNLVRVVKSAL